ncbi:FimB/Mfa2 family fimbrial subunit [Bacteroides sp. 519]|uniref:FimB/Mfa2 family fimbrial subunit n=1 Tax=Bacteroides sp. 519 TaxID=2302937 RepID=UPI0013D34700|nr:FimB/Mfa2 family fimbrial subunit [Bacteroides sp. 519]NDV59560.1 hypothetical protein [Bacteroides sp. 519]
MQTLRKIKHLVLLFSLFLFTGCLGEGDLDCDAIAAEGLTIQFLYNINPEFTNKISEVVEYIDLYIYKETGELYREVRLTKEQLEATNYKYSASLPNGTYKLATWMNNGDCYYREDTENFSDAGVRIKCNGNQEISENTAPLYYGYIDRQYAYEYEEEDAIVEIGKNPVRLNINFARNTNHIRVDAQFDRIPHIDDKINIKLEGKNGICNFYNRIPPYTGSIRNDEEMDEEMNSHLPTYIYYPYETSEAFNDLGYYYNYTSRLTTQRLWENDGMNIQIAYHENGLSEKVLINDKLTDLIMQNPLFSNSFHLERYANYHIIFQFDKEGDAWVIADIIVNDWHLIKQDENPGIGYE